MMKERFMSNRSHKKLIKAVEDKTAEDGSAVSTP